MLSPQIGSPLACEELIVKVPPGAGDFNKFWMRPRRIGDGSISILKAVVPQAGLAAAGKIYHARPWQMHQERLLNSGR